MIFSRLGQTQSHQDQTGQPTLKWMFPYQQLRHWEKQTTMPWTSRCGNNLADRFYTFTDYEFFMASSNTVIPIPNWPVNQRIDVPTSTTPPMSETDYNAIDFFLWKQLGRQILIKSNINNINNWLVSNPETGSLWCGAMWCGVYARNPG